MPNARPARLDCGHSPRSLPVILPCASARSCGGRPSLPVPKPDQSEPAKIPQGIVIRCGDLVRGPGFVRRLRGWLRGLLRRGLRGL